jgi:hypothetical protein
MMTARTNILFRMLAIITRSISRKLLTLLEGLFNLRLFLCLAKLFVFMRFDEKSYSMAQDLKKEIFISK